MTLELVLKQRENDDGWGGAGDTGGGGGGGGGGWQQWGGRLESQVFASLVHGNCGVVPPVLSTSSWSNLSSAW